MKLYKYVSPTVTQKMFLKDGYIGLRCNFPENYNDPFELFLSINSINTDLNDIAYYFEIVGKIPQIPTCCFSKRPDIVPMWAHYCKEHTGFVVEIDEESLANSISFGYIEDVEYSDSFGSLDFKQISYVTKTLKPRHVYRIQNIAFKNAYFTKNNCWVYEMERRLVVTIDDIVDIDGIMILFIPIQCVSAIISGARTPENRQKIYSSIAERIGCNYYRMKIGKLSFFPYLIDEDNRAFLFKNSMLKKANVFCKVCLEPVTNLLNGKCIWCSLTDEAKQNAALNNPIRMFQHYGLNNYSQIAFADLKPIGKRTKNI